MVNAIYTFEALKIFIIEQQYVVKGLLKEIMKLNQ